MQQLHAVKGQPVTISIITKYQPACSRVAGSQRNSYRRRGHVKKKKALVDRGLEPEHWRADGHVNAQFWYGLYL